MGPIIHVCAGLCVARKRGPPLTRASVLSSRLPWAPQNAQAHARAARARLGRGVGAPCAVCTRALQEFYWVSATLHAKPQPARRDQGHDGPPARAPVWAHACCPPPPQPAPIAHRLLALRMCESSTAISMQLLLLCGWMRGCGMMPRRAHTRNGGLALSPPAPGREPRATHASPPLRLATGVAGLTLALRGAQHALGSRWGRHRLSVGIYLLCFSAARSPAQAKVRGMCVAVGMGQRV
mgnify:CR=1 FL=1